MDEREVCERLRLIGNELRQKCKSRGIDCETCDRSQAALDHAIATIERERWIPVSEQLPGVGEHVEVLPIIREDTYNFYAHRDGGTNGVKAGRWYHNDRAGYDMEISATHWRRPLSDPQTDGQEG